jgi:hypothetical protein
MLMTCELCDTILSAGKNAAMQKMTLERNLSKPDMRLSSFSRLTFLLEDEVRELWAELVRSVAEKSLSIEVLNAIRDEAGDIVAFASGIAAKADLEISKMNPQPYLWERRDLETRMKATGPNSDSD